MIAVNLLAACVLDGLLGDPRWMPHPVRLIGAFINWCEPMIRNRCTSGQSRRIAGLLLVIFVPGFSFLAAWGSLHVAFLVHPWLQPSVMFGIHVVGGEDLSSMRGRSRRLTPVVKGARHRFCSWSDERRPVDGNRDRRSHHKSVPNIRQWVIRAIVSILSWGRIGLAYKSRIHWIQ